ncbi:MAG: hypothetical protein ACXVPN_08980 [Bacteroidia bacterium]
MNKVDAHILNVNKVICSNIDKLGVSDRGLLAQNILSQLRNLIEYIALKIYCNGNDIDVTFDNIEKANAYIKAQGKLKFLSRFHKLLQVSASHYTLDEESSERLMLKYFEYLIRIKTYLKASFALDILENLESFPIRSDSNLKEYYEKISEKIDQSPLSRPKSSYSDRYYIQKIKPFFIGTKIYYEVTFTRATDYTSKFDRIIAFTHLDISHNYAVKLSISNDNINILGKNMPIQIIDEWEVSIRTCELNNFAKLFGNNPKIGGNVEYYELMRYLTLTGFNLVEIVDFNDNQFENIRRTITQNANVSPFFGILKKCQEIIRTQKSGYNILRYLLYRLNNKIIKKQFNQESCSMLSGLYLDFGCIPFEQMPFDSSLKNHNPKLSDLFSCLDITDRQHEIFAKLIKNNTEYNGQLYTPKTEIIGFENIEILLEKWNNSLYKKHTHRKLETYKDHIYILKVMKKTHSILLKN